MATGDGMMDTPESLRDAECGTDIQTLHRCWRSRRAETKKNHQGLAVAIKRLYRAISHAYPYIPNSYDDNCDNFFGNKNFKKHLPVIFF
jgi:hypothetical protein